MRTQFKYSTGMGNISDLQEYGDGCNYKAHTNQTHSGLKRFHIFIEK